MKRASPVSTEPVLLSYRKGVEDRPFRVTLGFATSTAGAWASDRDRGLPGWNSDMCSVGQTQEFSSCKFQSKYPGAVVARAKLVGYWRRQGSVVSRGRRKGPDVLADRTCRVHSLAVFIGGELWRYDRQRLE